MRERRIPGVPTEGSRAPLASEQTLLERRRAVDRLATWIGGLFLRSEQLRGFVLMSPTLAIMTLLLAVPLGIVIAYSFWTKTGDRYEPLLTTANYENFFVHPAYPLLLGKSVLISLCVSVAAVGLAYPMAYFIAFRVKQAKMLWLILITVPFWTSYLLRVFSWKIVLGYNGVINSGLTSIGVIDEPLGFLLYNPIAVVITLAHAWAAFAILPIYVSLAKIDRSLLEAATDLGDGPLARFFRVTLPLSMPGVIAAGLLVFIPTVGDYVTPKLVGGTTGLMIGNIIQVMFGPASNWPSGAAIAVSSMISIGLSVVVIVWFARKMTRRIS